MIDVIATTARWILLTANFILLGSCVFIAIAGNDKNSFIGPWVERLERWFPWLGVSIIAGLLVILATTTSQVTSQISDLWQAEIWLGILSDTRMGHVWIIHTILALILLGVVLYLRNSPKARWRYILCAVIAALPLIAGSLVSHIAAEDFSVFAILPYALHIVLAGIWFGALPAFLCLMFVYIKQKRNKAVSSSDIQTLKRFSNIALPVMVLIVATGFYVAYRILDGEYATLVATPYGWLLIAKIAVLCIILIIAARVRAHWLPLFTNSKGETLSQSNAERMWKAVGIEFFLATILLVLAIVIANSATPAKHALIEEWPYPFRFSIAAIWDDPSVQLQVWIGLAIFAMALVSIPVGRSLHWNLKRLIIISSLLIITGLAVVLPPLTIEAYPETYRRTPIIFDATSIANGAQLYAKNCVDCHGAQGKGNGILSRTLSTMMPDMLTEAHVEAHTAGDLFHWISYGVKDTDMPGFSEKLSIDDRWDLVNFLHALFRGYQARVLTPEVIPNKPKIIPPGFFYMTYDGTSGILENFVEQQSVLLVIFSWPESRTRLQQLSQASEKLKNQNLKILAVPKETLSNETIDHIASNFSLPIVTEGATEIVRSYALSRRTLSNPDILGTGTIPDHMEFLIDRYGYLRARWIPSTGNTGWQDLKNLIKEIYLLNQEEKILPPAEDYVR